MTQIKIARRLYRRGYQFILGPFVEALILNMKGIAAYAAFQADVLRLEELKGEFDQAQAATVNGGPADTVVKNKAIDKLVAQTDVIANKMEAIPDVTEEFILRAGFQLQEGRTVRYGKPAAPTVLRCTSTDTRNQVNVSLSDALPKGVLTHLIQYSVDGGHTWVLVGHCSRRQFILEDIPTGTDIQLRFASLGSGMYMSDWTRGAIVSVP